MMRTSKRSSDWFPKVLGGIAIENLRHFVKNRVQLDERGCQTFQRKGVVRIFSGDRLPRHFHKFRSAPSQSVAARHRIARKENARPTLRHAILGAITPILRRAEGPF